MGKGEHEISNGYTSVYIVGDIDYGKRFVNTELPQNKIEPERMKARDSRAGEETMNADHAQALERLKERREREPLFFCKIVTRWPLQSFCKFNYLYNLLIFHFSTSIFNRNYSAFSGNFVRKTH